MSQHNPLIINPDGSQSPNPNYRGPHPYVKGADGKLKRIKGGKIGPGGVLANLLPFVEEAVINSGTEYGNKVKNAREEYYQAGDDAYDYASQFFKNLFGKSDTKPQPIPKQEFDSGRNTEPPNPNPNVPQKGTSMGGFADIRGSITPGSPIPAPTNNSGERSHEYEKEWQKSKKSVDGDVSKAEVPSLDKSYGSMSRQEMMDAYDRMRYGDNFDKAREAMSKAKGNPFDSTNNPAKFLVNEEGQKKAVKQGIEMNKHFFAPGGGREREINNPSTATPSAAPSLSDISTSNKGDGRSAFATSSQRAKDDAAKAGTLKPVTDAVNKVKSWLTGNSGGSGWGALGATIKFAEGTHRMGEKSYNTGFGYNMIDDLSKHPDTVWDGSAAAGAYQFMPNTWNEAKSALKLTDFGPQSQEKAGEFLTNRRGVQTDKQFKTVQEFREALDKLAPEWASIPLSSTGKSYYDGDGRNNARRFDELLKFYEKQVGYKLN